MKGYLTMFRHIEKLDNNHIITPDEIESIAKETGFIRRLRKINPFDFLITLVFRLVLPVPAGLRQIVSLLDKDISRSGLNQKFTEKAVDFMKKCLHVMISKQIANAQPIPAEVFIHFSRVIITDSSSWDVSDHMKNIFAGSGGSASEGNCKLQCCYDIKNGAIMLLDVTKGIEPDQNFSKKLTSAIRVRERYLFINDLGYWVTETFFRIRKENAYFVSRFCSSANLYSHNNSRYIPSKIGDILEKHRNSAAIESDVFLKAKDEYFPIRLIAFRVPREVADQRRYKSNKQAKKKGRTVSKSASQLCDWSVFVTNASEELIPSEMIRTIYRIRWSMELIFKDWKSILRMHKSNVKKNHNRFLCELYGKLILSVIVQSVYQKLRFHMWKYGKEISLNCLWKFINSRLESLHEAMSLGIDRFLALINSFFPSILKNCEKYHQRSRKTSLQRINEMIGDVIPSKVVI